MNAVAKKVKQAAINSLLAASAYSTWAFLINRGLHDFATGIKAAGVQACLSISATFIVTLITALLFDVGGRLLVRSVVTLIGANTALALFLYVVHSAAGTPRVVATILPSVLIGGVGGTAICIALNFMASGRTSQVQWKGPTLFLLIARAKAVFFRGA